ncbi:MAG: TMEM165/GDT1 family protein [Armatimonadetes bacterium]|nr:TMEM165/GDT1 family protein [Armatimonadota bacterium]
MTFAWPTVLAAFLASLVEFVEALTIVLAVGAVRGWRSAWAGTVAAALLLAVLVALFGPSLAHLDMPLFKMIVGTLLLLFGLRWLRKAILRAAGVLALHDEEKEYAETAAALRQGAASPASGLDFGAAAAAFNGVFIEGVEVVFIVLAVGAAGHKTLLPAVLGAAAAAALVVVLGLIARHPLSNIPENALKLAVGVLVSAFGTFWAGEGLGLAWPGGDWATVALSLGYLAVAGLGVLLARPPVRTEQARL